MPNAALKGQQFFCSSQATYKHASRDVPELKHLVAKYRLAAVLAHPHRSGVVLQAMGYLFVGYALAKGPNLVRAGLFQLQLQIEIACLNFHLLKLATATFRLQQIQVGPQAGVH